jgi:hypothetical protein
MSSSPQFPASFIDIKGAIIIVFILFSLNGSAQNNWYIRPVVGIRLHDNQEPGVSFGKLTAEMKEELHTRLSFNFQLFDHAQNLAA